MNRVIAPLIAVLASGLCAAQGNPALYAPGRAIADQKISLRSWGSGIATETEEAAFEGSTSIRIVSKNFFQGGTLQFGQPVALADAFGDKSNLLRVVYMDPNAPGASTGMGAGGSKPGLGGPSGGAMGGGGALGGAAGAPGGGAAGAPGGGSGSRGPGSMGGPPGGMKGGQGSGGGSRGGQMGGMGGAPMGGGMGASTTNPPLRTVRMVITTTDGKKSEAYVPVATSVSAQNGWRQVGIPLQAIKGFDATNKTVQSVTLSGDSNGAFYVGELRVVNDPTPIRAQVNQTSLNLAINDIVELSASATGGSSVLKYSWDFDDTDGISVDAQGPVIKHRFRKAGTFTVTLTVSDEFGLKEPYTQTIKVKVNG